MHDQLNPYYFSLAQYAYANDDVMMHPIGAERDWPNDFRFFVGDDFFIAPIVTPGGVRDIDVPKGTYRVGPPEPWGADLWLQLDPLFPTSRSALGIHNCYPGIGCICIPDRQELSDLADAVRRYNGTRLKVVD